MILTSSSSLLFSFTRPDLVVPLNWKDFVMPHIKSLDVEGFWELDCPKTVAIAKLIQKISY
jgi:hypothetical protein